MKIIPNLLLILVLGISACSEDTLTSENTPTPLKATDQKSNLATASTAATVTGLTNFKAANLQIPTGGLYDGTKFYGGLMRGCIAYYPYGVIARTRNNIPRVRFYVKPTSPTSYLVGTQYPYHYRSEVCRFPWKISHPLETEEWLGLSYHFPTKEESYSVNRTPVSIYQNHAGRVGTQTENPPALQLEIAFPGQLKDTPYGGEIMLVHHIRGIRYTIPGVRVVAGARIDIVMQIVYDLGTKGLWNVWINGVLVQIPGGNAGSTVWPPRVATDIPVGGNSKLGIYHHGFRTKTGVDLNYSRGHSHMQMFMSDWNDVFRHPGDWDYKNMNAYDAVSTAGYP
jgi:hypothetical protein